MKTNGKMMRTERRFNFGNKTISVRVGDGCLYLFYNKKTHFCAIIWNGPDSDNKGDYCFRLPMRPNSYCVRPLFPLYGRIESAEFQQVDFTTEWNTFNMIRGAFELIPDLANHVQLIPQNSSSSFCSLFFHRTIDFCGNTRRTTDGRCTFCWTWGQCTLQNGSIQPSSLLFIYNVLCERWLICPRGRSNTLHMQLIFVVMWSRRDKYTMQ